MKKYRETHKPRGTGSVLVENWAGTGGTNMSHFRSFSYLLNELKSLSADSIFRIKASMLEQLRDVKIKCRSLLLRTKRRFCCNSWVQSANLQLLTQTITINHSQQGGAMYQSDAPPLLGRLQGNNNKSSVRTNKEFCSAAGSRGRRLSHGVKWGSVRGSDQSGVI